VANVERVRLTSATYGVEVAQESFDSADLTSISLNQLWLVRCSFVGADLRHATLDNCRFKMCDLRRTNLRGASMRFVSLAGCDLRGADLRDCDLTGARLGFVNTGDVSGLTDLTAAILEGAVLDDATFERVVGWPVE
jgi:uncharacterized protein YjbI with pentapeptide repeats